MQRIAKFYKVSEENFLNSVSVSPEAAKAAYKALKLPVRATAGSAGYDFYLPFDLTLAPGETAKIPTGMRCRIADGWVLCIFPRSGLGFKYRLQLDNTVGVVDSDYFGSSNEGHIFVKITNDTRENKTLTLKAGDAFSQGVFLPFGITEDDCADGLRDGGFGSTDKK